MKKSIDKTASNFNVNSFIPIGKPIYFYLGSLTSPDCTENVNWVLTQEIMIVSLDQFNLLKQWIIGSLKENNSRAVKPLNSRKIYLQTNILINIVDTYLSIRIIT